MIKFYKIFILTILIILTSCSSEDKKISIIKEDDLDPDLDSLCNNDDEIGRAHV